MIGIILTVSINKIINCNKAKYQPKTSNKYHYDITTVIFNWRFN